MAAVEITSFGYLHAEPPAAHLTIDLRHHFRDPHISPELRYMTARDEPVRAAVLGTPGITELIDAIAAAVSAFASGPSAGPVVVADGCQGGRHRAPTFALTLADRLREAGHQVTVTHRDLHRPVVRRAPCQGPQVRRACRDALQARLSQVLDICDREQRNAVRWENPIPVPEWVAVVQRAALGDDRGLLNG